MICIIEVFTYETPSQRGAPIKEKRSLNVTNEYNTFRSPTEPDCMSQTLFKNC